MFVRFISVKVQFSHKENELTRSLRNKHTQIYIQQAAMHFKINNLSNYI